MWRVGVTSRMTMPTITKTGRMVFGCRHKRKPTLTSPTHRKWNVQSVLWRVTIDTPVELYQQINKRNETVRPNTEHTYKLWPQYDVQNSIKFVSNWRLDEQNKNVIEVDLNLRRIIEIHCWKMNWDARRHVESKIWFFQWLDYKHTHTFSAKHAHTHTHSSVFCFDSNWFCCIYFAVCTMLRRKFGCGSRIEWEKRLILMMASEKKSVDSVEVISTESI